MKRFVLAVALACALSGTILAGDIHTTDLPVPPPPPPSPVLTIIITIINAVTR